MNDLSGRAAFDRELSDLARAEARESARFQPPSIGSVKPPNPPTRTSVTKGGRVWPRHSRLNGRPNLSDYEKRRVQIWDMLGSYGMNSEQVAAEVGFDIAQVGFAMARGRPSGSSWHDVLLNEFPDHFDRALRERVARLMGAAARRWGCPARAIFGAASRKTVRITSILCARVEVTVRLRELHRMPVTEIGELLRIHHSAISYHRRLVQRDERFKTLRDEVNAEAPRRALRRSGREAA